MPAEAAARALEILRPAIGDRARGDYPLAPLTSFRLGGPASVYVEAASMDDLAAVSEALDETELPLLVVGKGSNVLISDEGFPGIVVRLGKAFRWAARDGKRVSAGGAMHLPALANVALAHELSGLEFGVAIPASVGGSVRMNAGAHGRSLHEVVESVEVFDTRERRLRVLSAADAGFSYRDSRLPERGIVVGATVALTPGDRDEIRSRMEDARRWRRETQPLAEANCGSVFKNPPGDHAARLIDLAGGKLLRVGGARVSEKHANFVIAEKGASARDVHELIGRVREHVHTAFDVWLEPEVHVVGRFGKEER